MKPDLVLFPYNGNAIEAFDCIDRKSYNFIGFIDDDKKKQGRAKQGFEIFDRTVINTFPHLKVLAVPGNSENYKTRADVISGLKLSPDRFITAIHPSAHVSELALIGKNCLIMAGVVITSNAVIGDHVCILPNTVVHHDVSIGEYTLVGSNVTLAGFVSIGKNCFIGSGSSVISYISVGDFSLVGMGTNLLRSVPGHSKVAGNPGRPIK